MMTLFFFVFKTEMMVRWGRENYAKSKFVAPTWTMTSFKREGTRWSSAIHKAD